MRPLKWLVVAINVAAGLLMLAIGGVAWFLSSERAAAWLVETAVARTGGAVSVERVGGTLLDTLTLGGVRVDAGGGRLELSQLDLEFDLWALLGGVLVVEDLRAGPVVYEQGSATAGSGPGAAPPTVPVAIVIRRAVVAGLTIRTETEELALDPTRFAARLVDGRLAIERFSTRARGVDVTGTGMLELGAPLRLSAALDWSAMVDGRELAGRLELAGTTAMLEIHHVLSSPFSVTADGTVSLEGAPSVDIDVAWQDAALPELDFVSSRSGTAHLAGEIAALNYESAGAVAVYGRDLDFSASGRLDGASLVIGAATLDAGARGHVDASGEIGLDTLAWELALQGRGVDPGLLAQDWPGRIDLSGDFSGELAPMPRVVTRNLSVSGQLRAYPFTASAQATYTAPRQFEITALDVSSNGDRARVSGRVGDEIDLAIDAELSRFERLWPDAAGSLSAKLTVSGTFDRPRIEGTAELEDVAYHTLGAARIALAGNVAAWADGPSSIEVTAQDLTAGALEAGTLELGSMGTLSDSAITLAVAAPSWSSTMQARGGLESDVWRGMLESVVIDQADLGEWRLMDPAKLEVGSGSFSLEASCIAQVGASVCATASIAGDPSDEIAVSAVNFDTQVLAPLFPEILTIQGIYQVALSLVNPTGTPRGRLSIVGGPTRARFALSEADVVETSIDGVSIGADLENWRLGVDLALNGRDTGRVRLDGSIDDLRKPDAGVDGTLEIDWDDISALTLLSPDVGEVGGTIAARLGLGGTLDEPAVNGSVEWRGGSIEVPAWGLVLADITASADSPNGRTLEFVGNANIEGQGLQVQGTTMLDPEQRFPTHFTIDGDSLKLIQRPDATVYVSPKLDVDVQLPEIRAKGDVLVPKADISIAELPSQAVRPSTDTIVHGEAEPEVVRPLHMQADISVTLGDDVHYAGANLDTKLSGMLNLSYESGRPPAATGAVDVSGAYMAYGQSLDLERSRLLFTGPLDDPGLDIRAARKIRTLDVVSGEVTAGVQLTGTLKQPEAKVFSEPAMSEGDALSYLLIGRPLSSAGESDQEALQTAAIAMGLQQALPAVQRIGTSIGLDELSIDTSDLDAGALMAGKYLGPNVYVRYSYSLFNRIGGLLLRFRFNDRFSIETRSGDQDSIDLLYTVEKN